MRRPRLLRMEGSYPAGCLTVRDPRDTGSDGAGERARGTRALGESIALIKDSGGLAEPARQRLLHSGDLVECIAQVPPREL